MANRTTERALTPADIVQAQLVAYNARDIDAFVELFAQDAQLFELGAAAPSTVGAAAIRTRYQALFDQSPNLCSIVVSRTALGRAVVDLETITGRLGDPKPILFLAIYEVVDAKIVRVHFVRQ